MAAKAKLEGELTLQNAPFIRGLKDGEKAAQVSGQRMKSIFGNLDKEIAANAEKAAAKRAAAFGKLGGGTGIGTLGGGLAAAAGAAVVATAAVAKQIIEFGSQIKDLADTTNLSAESFQRYSFAVEQSGGSQEVFVKGMVALSQAVQDAKNGTGKAADAFGRLGIGLDKVFADTPEQLFLELANAMQKSSDKGAAFSAISDLLGVKIATKLVPSLKLGAAGFKELADSAPIASQADIDRVEALGDALGKVWRLLKTEGVTAIGAVDKKLEGLVSRFNEFQAATGGRMIGAGTKPGMTNLPGLTQAGGASSTEGSVAGLSFDQDIRETLEKREKALQEMKAQDSGALASEMEMEQGFIDAMKEESDARDKMNRPQTGGIDLGAEFFKQRAQEMRDQAIQALHPLPVGATAADDAMAAANRGTTSGRLRFKDNLYSGVSTRSNPNAHDLIRRGDRAARKAEAEAARQKAEADKKALADPIVAAINKPDWVTSVN